MNEWLLIVLLSAPTGISQTMIKLPSQATCVAAGEEAFKMRGMMTVGRYSCTEIKVPVVFKKGD